MYTNIDMDDWMRMNFRNIFIEEIKRLLYIGAFSLSLLLSCYILS